MTLEKKMTDYRTERDSIGQVNVPKQKYWGAQTQRSLENFKIGSDKVARTFAEMENQRRRFEKEKEDAFEYGGYSFAKEALNLIDNLDRSKHVLESDNELKETVSLKKILEHLDIIKKDLISIFEKNNIKPIDAPMIAPQKTATSPTP